MKEPFLIVILLSFITATLMGCSQLQMQTVKKPTKPVLRAITQTNGDVCFTKQDATELGIYILELERK